MKKIWYNIQQWSVKWLDRNTPPGFPRNTTLTALGWGWGIGFVWSLYFFIEYSNCYDLLFYSPYRGGPKVMNEGAIMADFFNIVDGRMMIFWVMVLASIGLAVLHYNYHFQGSKSIYLMKRLPDKGDLWRRCIALPAVIAAISIAMALILTVLYYIFYMNVTPEQCIAPGQWEKLWSAILGRQGGY